MSYSGGARQYNLSQWTLWLPARALLNLELTPAQLSLFQIYADELQAWNAKFNLTAIKERYNPCYA